MNVTFLAGFAAGASVALGFSIAFVLFCMRWAKTHRVSGDHYEDLQKTFK